MVRSLRAAPGWRLATAAGLLCWSLGAAQAGTLRYCDASNKLSASQQDRLLRVSGLIKDELERSGAQVALIARSGLNLRLFDMRYSHAGLSLKASPGGRWSVRQLYFSCDEQQSRLFDQGLSAFLLGTEDPSMGFISVVTLPAQDSREVEATALDNRQALALLGGNYSANAYAFSTQYQNCNQWLIELLATAWSAPAAAGDRDPREAAQGWLKAQGFEPAVFSLGWRPLTWATAFSPWLNRDDHPAQNLAQAQFHVSMPASIESLLRQRVAGAERIEFCHTDRHVLIRRGWQQLAEGCVATESDTVVALD